MKNCFMFAAKTIFVTSANPPCSAATSKHVNWNSYKVTKLEPSWLLYVREDLAMAIVVKRGIKQFWAY